MIIIRTFAFLLSTLGLFPVQSSKTTDLVSLVQSSGPISELASVSQQEFLALRNEPFITPRFELVDVRPWVNLSELQPLLDVASASMFRILPKEMTKAFNETFADGLYSVEKVLRFMKQGACSLVLKLEVLKDEPHMFRAAMNKFRHILGFDPTVHIYITSPGHQALPPHTPPAPCKSNFMEPRIGPPAKPHDTRTDHEHGGSEPALRTAT